MDFLFKIRDMYLALPFPIQIIIGIFFINIFPPLGIGIIIFAGISRKRRRNNYYKKNEDTYNDTYQHDRNTKPSIVFEKKENEYRNNNFSKNKQSNKINNSHINDMKSAEKILSKIKEYLKKENLKQELKNIYSKMQIEFENTKKISKKIDEINEILNDPDWDLNRVLRNINNEKNKITQDPKRLERMYEMHNHIQQLHERKARLCNQISDLNISFQTIYTKITLLDIQEESNFDEIETEIQRILNFKLKVEHYEDKLDKELKEFL